MREKTHDAEFLGERGAPRLRLTRVEGPLWEQQALVRFVAVPAPERRREEVRLGERTVLADEAKVEQLHGLPALGRCQRHLKHTSSAKDFEERIDARVRPREPTRVRP